MLEPKVAAIFQGRWTLQLSQYAREVEASSRCRAVGHVGRSVMLWLVDAVVTDLYRWNSGAMVAKSRFSKAN